MPGTEVTRSYSFANAPHEERLVFLVKLTPGGAMSTWLTERAAVGDEVTFTGPHGSFYWRGADKPAVLLAGGTGLAPILSMLRAMRAAEVTRSVHVIYGVTSDEDVVKLDEIAQLTEGLPATTWDYCVADSESSAPNRGYVTSLIRPEHLHDGDAAVYLCGPPAMVDAVRDHVSGANVEPAGFFYEKFTPAILAQTNPTTDAANDPTLSDHEEKIIPHGDARSLAGQEVHPAAAISAWDGPVARTDHGDAVRRIAGQAMFPQTPTEAATNGNGPVLTESGTQGPKDNQNRDSGSHAPLAGYVAPERFTGQVVVVTGAAQGIGAEVARRIGAEGGTVVAVDRSELVSEVVEQIVASGGRALQVLADLEQSEGAASVIDKTIAAYGQVDVLVNNVGGAINFKPYIEFTPSEIDAEITRSLMTTMYACRAALPAMVAAGNGVIVNVSSTATRGINRIPYSAAKGAVNALTASLAMEYADAGVRVVATAPGGTDAPPRRISRGTPTPASELEEQWATAHIGQTLASSLMHRYGSLAEQAAAICFLASREASFITGSVLPVAGGDLG